MAIEMQVLQLGRSYFPLVAILLYRDLIEMMRSISAQANEFSNKGIELYHVSILGRRWTRAKSRE